MSRGDYNFTYSFNSQLLYCLFWYLINIAVEVQWCLYRSGAEFCLGVCDFVFPWTFTHYVFIVRFADFTNYVGRVFRTNREFLWFVTFKQKYFQMNLLLGVPLASAALNPGVLLTPWSVKRILVSSIGSPTTLYVYLMPCRRVIYLKTFKELIPF